MIASQNKTEEHGDRTRATAIVIFLFALVFFALSWFKIGRTDSKPKDSVIEIVLEKEVRRPPGVKQIAPQQRPVASPAIINKPGLSAPESAKIAATNQSTKPKPQPKPQPSKITDKGDIETKTTPTPKINQKGLFQSNSSGKEEAKENAEVSEDKLFHGVGRETQATRTNDTPIGPDHRSPVTANLSGRTIVGSLPLPSYNSRNYGTVVVEITVDQNGNVTKSAVRPKGTTVQARELWRAAEDAARKAKFNMKTDAPVYQIGTITYIFSLK
ncbi:MAG: energy transducer TonB [Prevotellaceae bacterium]|jgi:TonB family protein|nr:energy transducer TonB [Prevotellaceae bacterium]